MTITISRLLPWTLLTTVGLAGGITAAVLLGKPIQAIVGMMLVAPIVTSVVGVVLGTTQRMYLRSLLVRPNLWVLATALGTGIGLTLGVVVVEQGGRVMTGHRVHLTQLGAVDRALSFCVVGLVSGFCLGLAQYIVIRHQRILVKKWIPTTAVGLGLAFGLSSLIVDLALGGIRSAQGLAGFVLLAGLMFGAATATRIVRTMPPEVASAS